MFNSTTQNHKKTKNELIASSEKIAAIVQFREFSKNLFDEFKLISLENLSVLNSDDAKKSFWLNVYNAFYFYSFEFDVDKDHLYFLRTKKIKFKNFSISLWQIEHHIFKNNKFLWDKTKAMFFNFSGKKQLCLKRADFRLCFALRPRRYYDEDLTIFSINNLEAQLSENTRSFLLKSYRLNENELSLSPILHQFFPHYKVKARIKNVLLRYEMIRPMDVRKKVKFNLKNHYSTI